jgi:Chloroplast import apparatus Tic20-like
MLSQSMMILFVVLLVTCLKSLDSFRIPSFRPHMTQISRLSMKSQYKIFDPLLMSDNNTKPVEKTGISRLFEIIEESDKEPDDTPPIYEPGPYPFRLLAALAYLVPIVDASDVGKYMFEAYPDVGAAYNTLFGPVAAIFNGVPFLPFVVYFAMSYICRAPSFPVEVRFHFAQAFMLSIIQFLPVLLLNALEKGGVPGLGVLYNSCKLSLW